LQQKEGLGNAILTFDGKFLIALPKTIKSTLPKFGLLFKTDEMSGGASNENTNQ
jgi:hypothetical protein